MTATSRTGLVGGGLGFTISTWVNRQHVGGGFDSIVDYANGDTDSTSLRIKLQFVDAFTVTGQNNNGMSYIVFHPGDTSGASGQPEAENIL
jgi:hypothetical protein